MLCHSIYLQVVKVHLFNYSISRVSYVHSSRTTDESLHFRSSQVQKTKTLSLALYIVIVTQGHLVRKDLHKTLKYVDKFSELK